MVELHYGDAVQVLPRYAGQAALVYLDPCFNKGRAFRVRGEVAFRDTFGSEEHFGDYVLRLVQSAHGALAEHGTLVLHCDPSFVHLARTVCDRVFGAGSFLDQIVWHYRRWPIRGRRCNRLHDYLVCYAIDPSKARWTQLYQPLAASTRRQWKGAAQKAMVRDGTRRRSIATDEESRGAPIGDVWTDINAITRGREYTGFETQKPEALLARVIEMRSLPGDLVIDGTLGSGTSAVVARRMGRRFVGIDRSEVSLRVARERLAQMESEAA